MTDADPRKFFPNNLVKVHHASGDLQHLNGLVGRVVRPNNDGTVRVLFKHGMNNVPKGCLVQLNRR